MSGIVGIAGDSAKELRLVRSMLDKVSHRGRTGSDVISLNGGILGVAWTECQAGLKNPPFSMNLVQDIGCDGREARAILIDGNLELDRDRFGIAPLYYGHFGERLYFASEVKALLLATQDVNVLPPGYKYDGNRLIPRFTFGEDPLLDDHVDNITKELRGRIYRAVRNCIDRDEAGILLSGGLDSSVITAFVPSYVKLHTFSIGLEDAPDLEAARQVAQFIKSEHHELVVTLQQILDILPEVIYYLESFDALLVRSSVINYLIAKEASKLVPTILVGEGADGLFAGFERYKSIPSGELPGVLGKDIMSMHNQGLQRVDRCSMAHGLVAYAPFLDFELVEYSMCIPPALKIKDGVEKWILRMAVEGNLPPQIINRPKDAFWSSGGVQELLSEYAYEHISLDEFARERVLPNGWFINTPEELMYYRIFRDWFGSAADNPTWVGRTTGAPFLETGHKQKLYF